MHYETAGDVWQCGQYRLVASRPEHLRPDRSMAKHKGTSAPSKKHQDPNQKLVAENRKARHRFNILETLECGIALVGSEVKSLRAGKLSLDEAYGRVRGGELWLVNSNIQEYVQANRMNHEPTRPRKLLVHRRELSKFAGQAKEKGLTLVPLKMYFTEGRAKVLMGLCRGKKLHDKRESLKKADSQRQMDRAMRRSK